LVAIFTAAWIGNLIVKRLILRGLERMMGLLWRDWSQNVSLQKAIRRLSNIVPALIIMLGASMIPEIPEKTAAIFDNLCITFIALCIALTFSNVLDALNHAYEKRPEARAKPIKGYLQLAKIVIY